MSLTLRKIITPLLLLLGVMLWQLLGRDDVWGNLPAPIIWAVVLVVGVVLTFNRRAAAMVERVAHPAPRTRLIVAAVVAIAAGGYLYSTAVRQGRDFAPKILDEYSYAIQARMLASGRLWLPPHPAADSFDSAYVIVRPVYASMYFPGTAIMLVPALWLGLPWWVTPLALSALSVGVLYRVVTEMVDGVAGLLAALLLVSLPIFRELSLRLYSQTPMLFLAPCAIWAWLAWRRDPRTWRAAVLGVLAGWMLVTRPLDAMAFLLPLGIATAVEVRRTVSLARYAGRGQGEGSARLVFPDEEHPPREPSPQPSPGVPSEGVKAAVAFLLAVTPFLVLQLAANRGITGSFITTPHALYAARDFPGATLGFHAQAPPESLVTKVAQKRALYRDAQPEFEAHRPENVIGEVVRGRLPQTVTRALPNNLLIILLPLGVAALARARGERTAAWLIVGPLPIFLLAYAFYLFYYSHYVLVVAPAVVTLIVLAVADFKILRVAVAQIVALLAIHALPEFDRGVHDDTLSPSDLRQIDQLLATIPREPALVLFTWQPGVPFWREPVYNPDAANIDSATVIRAHDLPGEPNRKLIEYYASRQPGRQLYVVTRVPGGAPTLRSFGRVADVRPEDLSAAIIPPTTQPHSN